MTDNAPYGGWVKIHRSFLVWEWYGDTNCVRLALHFILKANYQSRKWEGITIERGQLVTTRGKLVEELHLTDQQIRTALDKLVNSNFVTKSATKTYTVITVCNYDVYQPEKTDNNQDGNLPTTNEQPTDNQRATNEQPIDKNIKKYKELKEVKESLCFACAHATEAEREIFFETFFFKNFKNPEHEVERFCANYEASGWIRRNGQPAVDRVALARIWTQEDPKAAPRFQEEFIRNYRGLYNLAKNQNPKVASVLIHDLFGVALEEEKITLFCSLQMRDIMEGSIAFFRDNFFTKHYAGRNIHYRSPRQ